MAGLMRIALSILLVAGIGKAQIPEPCANANSFSRKECCPSPGPDAGPCGMNLTPSRGECVDIPVPYNGMINRSEPRQSWPQFFFNRTCNCASNYGGYDCGECAFGYRGPTCNQRYTRRRRSTSELTDQEWNTYITQLRMAKSRPSRYKVITSAPDYNNETALQTEPIGVYNLFVWFHHYVAKDNDGENPPNENDYSHEATGFPTWHRLFLLWFEREMQNMTGDDNFTVHYWDWRDPSQRRSLFTRDRLGEHNMNTATLTGNSKLVANGGWRTVCWYKGSGGVQNTDRDRICNPNTDTGPLQRCPNKTTCATNYEGWPSYEDVETAVSKQDYDSSGYNKYSREGFRGFMEGFQLVDRCGSSSDRRRDLCTEISDTTIPETGLQRLLHNAVHIILGLGTFPDKPPDSQQGVMGNVPASANDPIFINHHAMVDCILEKWLQNNIDREDYPPDPSIRAGHRRDDYIVPFIPLYTHNMMYKRAEELGYTCNLPDPPTTPTTTTTTRATTAEPDSAKPVTALYSVVVLAIVGSATFMLFF